MITSDSAKCSDLGRRSSAEGYEAHEGRGDLPLSTVSTATLRASGYIAMSGQIVDASLIAAPKQRNTQEEKQAIKEGRHP